MLGEEVEKQGGARAVDEYIIGLGGGEPHAWSPSHTDRVMMTSLQHAMHVENT